LSIGAPEWNMELGKRKWEEVDMWQESDNPTYSRG